MAAKKAAARKTVARKAVARKAPARKKSGGSADTLERDKYVVENLGYFKPGPSASATESSYRQQKSMASTSAAIRRASKSTAARKRAR